MTLRKYSNPILFVWHLFVWHCMAHSCIKTTRSVNYVKRRTTKKKTQRSHPDKYSQAVIREFYALIKSIKPPPQGGCEVEPLLQILAKSSLQWSVSSHFQTNSHRRGQRFLRQTPTSRRQTSSCWSEGREDHVRSELVLIVAILRC